MVIRRSGSIMPTGQEIKETSPTNGVTTMAYDAAGQETSVIDALGRTITYAYDADGRETGSTWKSATGTVTNVQTFTYDAVGNNLTAADYSGTYTNSLRCPESADVADGSVWGDVDLQLRSGQP